MAVQHRVMSFPRGRQGESGVDWMKRFEAWLNNQGKDGWKFQADIGNGVCILTRNSNRPGPIGKFNDRGQMLGQTHTIPGEDPITQSAGPHIRGTMEEPEFW